MHAQAFQPEEKHRVRGGRPAPRVDVHCLDRAVFAHLISAFVKQTCLILTHSGVKEVEADLDGLMLAAEACVDVTQSYEHGTKMAENNVDKSNWLWFMSAHLTYESRDQHLSVDRFYNSIRI